MSYSDPIEVLIFDWKSRDGEHKLHASDREVKTAVGQIRGVGLFWRPFARRRKALESVKNLGLGQRRKREGVAHSLERQLDSVGNLHRNLAVYA